MFSRALALTALTFATTASAAVTNGGLKILAPGGDGLWWVAQSINNVAWSCAESSFSQFTVWINNSDITLVTAITAIIPVEQNFNCIQGIDPNSWNVPVGKGYTIVLTDINNSTNVYAVSDPFEIKAVGSTYPATSATPVDQMSATVVKSSSASGSATNSGSGAAATHTGAAPRSVSASLTAGALAVGALLAVVAVV
ncbi:hypothetical protein FB451DRAFT_729610 [Mycena latifolia]|nr:hypothetical protein FB451DRAFT_729610 [Mycena latifolia]